MQSLTRRFRTIYSVSSVHFDFTFLFYNTLAMFTYSFFENIEFKICSIKDSKYFSKSPKMFKEYGENNLMYRVSRLGGEFVCKNVSKRESKILSLKPSFSRESSLKICQAHEAIFYKTYSGFGLIS